METKRLEQGAGADFARAAQDVRLDGRRTGPGADQVQLMDVDAVAAMLNCSPRTVWRLADGGKMPAPVHIGRLVRWSRKALTAWIDAGCPAARQVLKAG
jgi:excisionase family DNA binding protein